MKKELREKAIKLRVEKELSYSAIRKQLGVSKSSLSYWLRDYPLSEKKILELRRKGWKKGEASRERYRNTMRAKYEKEFKESYTKSKNKFRRISDESLYIAGLMLYLGEGKKKDKYNVSLSNTDPDVIRFFVWWMEKYLKIPKQSLRAQLHLYESMDIGKEKKFWKNVTGFDTVQFYKSQIRKLKKGSFSYSESYRHGTCQIYFSGKAKKLEVMTAMQAFVDMHMKGECSSVVERRIL